MVYRISCGDPEATYSIDISSQNHQCKSSDHYISNERVTYNVTKHFYSHGLEFLQIELKTTHKNKSFYLRTVGSKHECLSILTGNIEALGLVKIGNWDN